MRKIIAIVMILWAAGLWAQQAPAGQARDTVAIHEATTLETIHKVRKDLAQIDLLLTVNGGTAEDWKAAFRAAMKGLELIEVQAKIDSLKCTQKIKKHEKKVYTGAK
jgi:hypothetical protein